jgi:hypothetical protein
MITISVAAQVGLLVAAALFLILVWRTRPREAPQSGRPDSDRKEFE